MKKKQEEQAAEAAKQRKDKQLKEEKQKQYDAALALQKKLPQNKARLHNNVLKPSMAWLINTKA
ncbi:MAG: hypothetical protein LRY67_02335 [Gammaproteobacteria bacterium]|nr:hypothetical protein [Gammaproteobacteria bacterium]